MTETARFTISLHRTPDPEAEHLDLFIERGEVLATFQLASLADLSAAVGKPVAVRRLADHRKRYLSYQGPVSGNRGTVELRDQGTCVTLEAAARTLVVTLHGKQVEGTFKFTAADRATEEALLPGDWTLVRQDSHC